ncbi:hypothetical protein BN1263310023 [Stenotrophomonas indicatrix]|nr:hypothetical protein BN1263310023 [Stenotrophomonas indicatrix]
MLPRCASSFHPCAQYSLARQIDRSRMRRMNRMPLLKFFTLTRASAERACLPGALRGR